MKPKYYGNLTRNERNLKIFSFCIAPNYKLLSDIGFFFSRYHKNPLKSIIHEDDRELKLHSGQYKCTNPSRHIFRSLSSILYEFMYHNRLDMASENKNFQVEFSKLTLHFCLFWFFRSSISLDPWFSLISKSKQKSQLL